MRVGHRSHRRKGDRRRAGEARELPDGMVVAVVRAPGGHWGLAAAMESFVPTERRRTRREDASRGAGARVVESEAGVIGRIRVPGVSGVVAGRAADGVAAAGAGER